MSMFNVDAFLNSQTNAPLSTERKLIPPNTYPAVVEKLEVKSGVSEKSGNAWARMDVTFEITDQNARDFTMRSKVLLTHGIMLDLTEDGSALDSREGRNIALGRFYQALDMNEAGASPLMAVGRMCQVRIEHGSYNGNAREEIKAITKA